MREGMSVLVPADAVGSELVDAEPSKVTGSPTCGVGLLGVATTTSGE
jgi:hypothetical protein